MKKIISTIFIYLLVLGINAQKADTRLLKKLNEAIKGFNGDVGIFVKDLKTGKMVTINADTLFPTASIIKVPILIGVIDKIEKGELTYDSVLIYKDSMLYAGEDILGSFKDGEKIYLKKLILLMLTMSDNTASLWLQQLAGTGSSINSIMDNLGLAQTRVNSRTPGRGDNWAVYGWGQTTPREMATLFEMIYRHKIFSAEACDHMLRFLGRNYWDDRALSQVPPYIQVFSKNGAVDAVRSEVLLVNAPHHPYIFCLFTKNNKDQSWLPGNEAWQLSKKVSKLLWNYFEPDDKWKQNK